MSGNVLIVYGLLVLGILAAIGGLVWYADSHWKTTAGVNSGKAEVSAEWEAAKRQQREKDEAAAREASVKLGGKDERRSVVYRTITKAVDRVVVEYRDRPCLDDDGLRVARDAIRGQAAVTSKLGEALPASDAAN